MNKINLSVFFPPILLIMGTIIFSQLNNELFSHSISAVNNWILENFNFLFSWSSFLFLPLLVFTYFSPVAKNKIGGKEAIPLLNKPRWFAISTCTTIATGILFWGCAEPLFHYSNPPVASMPAFSQESMDFAMATMFMHWSFTPYAIYCVTGLVFALTFYNKKRVFSVFSVLDIPQEKQSKLLTTTVDVICLYALVLGMSASLGAGIYSIIGGIEEIWNIPKSNFLIGIVGSVIIACFIISAISGLQRGIKWLSTINIIGFILIVLYVFASGYPFEILTISYRGLQEYVLHFVERSLNLNGSLNEKWFNAWSIFNWANWFAWTPIVSLFLGKISKGYTVREYINFNLILPALFGILWMTIFSGTTLHINAIQQDALYKLMETNGEESILYAILKQLEYSNFTIPFIVGLIFLSYVTAADSNLSVISSLSENNLDNKEEASITIKIIWGIIIGSLTYIMLSTKGLDGIKILSVLGGFPAIFIVIGAAITLLRILWSKNI